MIQRAGFLTFDLGTDCGWCRERPGETPLFGTWNLRAASKHEGAIYCNEIDFLYDMIEGNPPEKIVYEAPFMMIPKDKEGKPIGNAGTQERLIGFTIPVKVVACRFSIPIFAVAVQSARAAFLHGNAKKPEIYAEAIRRGWAVKNEHESDAGALMDYCVQLFHPEEWARANPQLAVEKSQKRRRR